MGFPLPSVLHGAAWFKSVGTAGTPGTKLVSLAGAVRHPGLHEVPLGTPIRTIIDEYGGGHAGEVVALLVGGHSGSILPVSLLDTPYDVQPLQAVRGPVALADVEHEADQAVDLARVVAHHVHHVADPAIAAILRYGAVVGLVVHPGLRLRHAEVHYELAIFRMHARGPVVHAQPAIG